MDFKGRKLLQEPEEEEEHDLPEILAVLMFCMVLCFILESALHHYKVIGNWLPASGAFICVGVVVGAFILIWEDREFVRERYGLNVEIFDFLLLPPIIFDGAYSMKQLFFWRNFLRIGIFAVVGTLISTLLVTIPTYFLGKEGVYDELPLALAVAFAALISAVDPVAALAVYGSLGVNERLYALVFGESMINDAVSIVIYRVATNLIHVSFDGDAVLDSFVEFVKASIAALGIGFGIGVIAALVFKHLKFLTHHHIVSSLLIWSFGYSAFLVAESARCSGIISTLFCGFTLRHYAFYNLTTESQSMSVHFSHQVSTFAETVVYMQLGFTALGLVDWSAPFILLTIVWINIGRAMNIFPLAFILNIFHKSEDNPPLALKEQVAMFHAGLRGAIALALAITLPHEAAEHREMLVTCTLIVVIWTVFFNGGTTVAALSLLKVEMQDDLTEDEAHALVCEACATQNRVPLTTTEVKEMRFDNRFLRPLLTHYDPDTAEEGSHQFGHPESLVASKVKEIAQFV